MASQLTASERREFNKLDDAVAMGSRAARVVDQAGAALLRIREAQLFRDVAPTWEQYLERHELTVRRAEQMMQFAIVMTTIEAVAGETGTTVPVLTERACRPLVGLGDDEAQEAIRAAVADGGLSPRTIAKAAAARRGRKSSAPRPMRLRLPGGTVIIEINKRGIASGVDAESLLTSALDAIRRGRSEAA